MAFRAIQPSPAQPAGDGTNSQKPPDMHFRLPKHNKIVQACENCRKAKSKCDGKRPKCQTCIKKKRQCGYIGQDGQTMRSAAKTRLKSLEQLFANLQTSSSEEANRLFQQIRSGGDPIEAIQTSSRTLPSMHEPPSIPTEESHTTGKATTVINTQVTGSPLASSSTRDLLQPCVPFFETMRTRNTVSEGLEPVATPDRQPVLALTTEQPSILAHPQLPDASVTALALDSFFNCSGKLFHVFERDCVFEYYRDIFDAGEPSPEFPWAKAGCIMAVAAVGAQYLPGEFSQETETHFYDLARKCFDTVLEQQPLHAVKICTLLAQYNILDKSMVALVGW